MKLSLVLVIAAFLAALAVSASTVGLTQSAVNALSAEDRAAYLTIDESSVSVTLIEGEETPESQRFGVVSPVVDDAFYLGRKDDDKDDKIDAGKIINIAKEVWQFIEDNKPVASVATSYATGTPVNVKDIFGEMSGWAMPRTLRYEAIVKNIYGIEVLNAQISVSQTALGKLNSNGAGEYLTSCGFSVDSLNVAWGYTYEAKSTVINVLNSGSPEEPLAMVQLEFEHSLSSLVYLSTNKLRFTMLGDNRMYQE